MASKPAEIADVVFTQLHFDHVGWASLEGKAVFPKTAYRCSALDQSFP
jgi:glyoxylase-like metal-dependent hydrolase (beta-lactamase superfamily II)